MVLLSQDEPKPWENPARWALQAGTGISHLFSGNLGSRDSQQGCGSCLSSWISAVPQSGLSSKRNIPGIPMGSGGFRTWFYRNFPVLQEFGEQRLPPAQIPDFTRAAARGNPWNSIVRDFRQD